MFSIFTVNAGLNTACPSESDRPVSGAIDAGGEEVDVVDDVVVVFLFELKCLTAKNAPTPTTMIAMIVTAVLRMTPNDIAGTVVSRGGRVQLRVERRRRVDDQRYATPVARNGLPSSTVADMRVRVRAPWATCEWPLQRITKGPGKPRLGPQIEVGRGGPR